MVTAQLTLLACATAQEQPLPVGVGSFGGEGGTDNSSAGMSGSQTSFGSGSSAGSSSLGGSSSTGGSAQTGTGGGGTGNSAFGGTGNSAFGGTGGKPAGGSANAGGSSSGGHGGTGGGVANGGSSAAGAGGKSAGGTGGATTSCLTGWETDLACDTCSTQTQGDHKTCSVVLQCYEHNDCTPTTCGQPTQTCGQKTLETQLMGTAALPIAQMVYACRCP